MTAHTHTSPTHYAGQAVTVTVTGLPEQAAQAVTRYTDELTHALETDRLARQLARSQAWQIAEQQARLQLHVPTEEERLERARRGERAARPAVAEIRIAEPSAGGGAYLRLFDRKGGQQFLLSLTERPRAGVRAPFEPVTEPLEQGAMSTALVATADERMEAAGFRRAAGAAWQSWSRSGCCSGQPAPRHARVPVEPTAAYLAFVDAAYGPEPQLPTLAHGWSIRRRQRGRWTVRQDDAEYWDLTWQPVLGGARWRVWDERVRPQLLATHDTAPDALAAIGAPLT
ncbi:hypothetical protein V2W30_41380 (plasmid) [Streptomyces sp. Q6]|uniref:Uncharacterized protein n=1 Tax=Streptomyces citrinus TaxID=3118173 RepID=A0ACD5AR05_9ACTN